MTFPYVIDWTPQLRAEADAARVRDTFGGYVWPSPTSERRPRPVPVEQSRMKPQERMDEAEWLLDNGMAPWEVAAALGTTRHALHRSAYRCGRPELAQRLDDPAEEYAIKKGRRAA